MILQDYIKDHPHSKADGGAIELTEDSLALSPWMPAGPEISRVVDESVEAAEQYYLNRNRKHCNDKLAAQNDF